MNETTRTITYVGVALVGVLGAVFLSPSKPPAPSEFSEVGKPFYNDFSATDAKSLEVVKFNEDTAELKRFGVAFKNGVWVITSHRDYPADGKDRLSKTAASMVGITRAEFKTSTPADYAELGVIDPEETDAEKLKGRGTRITLKTDDGRVLCDYIVGKPVKGHQGDFYVRRPDEKSVYVAKLNIDLSTKFSDWIEADLLQIQPDELREITIDNYSIDEDRGRILQGDIIQLSRDSGTGPWSLEKLDPQKEEVNTAEVQKMVSALDNLKIIGVRRKPEGLSQELKTDEGPRIDVPTMLELRSRGFFIVQEGLRSKEGDLVVGTGNGAEYTIRFGQVFTGSEMELEAGLGSEQKEGEKKDDREKKPDENPSSELKGRYAFITCTFNPSLLGPKPEKPTRPGKEQPEAAAKPKEAEPEKKPEEAKPEPEEKPDAAKKPEGGDESKKPSCADDEAEPKEPKKDDAPEAKADDKPAKDPGQDEKPAADEKPKDEKPAVPDPAELQYQAALKKYEADLKAYHEKVKAGKEKVKELNNRFADWYYVLSADSFNQLHLGRKELVKPKPQPPATKPESDSESGEEQKPAVKKEPAPPASPEAQEKAQDKDEKPDSAAKEADSQESRAPQESPAKPE